LGITAQHGLPLGPRKQHHAGEHLPNAMPPYAHCSNHAEVASSAAYCPEQVWIVVVIAIDEAAIGKHNLGAEKIVQCQAVTRRQGTLPASRRQSHHANGATVASRGNQALWCGS